MGEYLRPTSVDGALRALGTANLTIIAGGTDIYPARVGRPFADDVLDLSAVAGLGGIEESPDGWRIGARATWSELIAADLPAMFDGLKLAAREVGGVQIQNAGTIAGNLCNASPAADGVPPLLSLDASVELAAQSGAERMALADFILGNRRTARRADQLMTAIHVPKPATGRARGHFLKLGARKYLVISITMVAAVIELDDDDRVRAARVAVGACSEVAQRLPALEAELVGQLAASGLGALAAPGHLAALAPIDDIRGSGGYRLDAALTLVRRTLDQLAAAP